MPQRTVAFRARSLAFLALPFLVAAIGAVPFITGRRFSEPWSSVQSLGSAAIMLTWSMVILSDLLKSKGVRAETRFRVLSSVLGGFLLVALGLGYVIMSGLM